ncbi:helix-turn-helix domain-containing protein [Streptomyces sp. NPDC059819]|uniref:helix-turn-helix domain-containing protein n=1 Tax=Streptomyces sp. NPDC059819 TaxID=3346963 RepID=UPI00365923D5
MTPDESLFAHAGWPGPGVLTSPADFVRALRQLKAVSGLSLHELQLRTGIPRSTIAHALKEERGVLPPWDRVLALLRACDIPDTLLPQWKSAWARITLSSGAERPLQTGGPSTGPITDAAADESSEADKARQDSSYDVGGPLVPGDESSRQAPQRPHSTEPRAKLRTSRRAARALLLVLSHVLVLAIGLVIAGPPAPQHGGAPNVGYPVEEKPCPILPTVQQPVTGPSRAAAPAGELPSWVGRPAEDAQILSATDVALPILTPAKAGDALVVSVMLTATCPGRVAVTDTRGDTYNVVGDVTDSGHHRTLIIAGFHIHALDTADSIHVVYPHASKYHVVVDEYRGIGESTGHAQAFGESGGAAFSTGSVGLRCASGDLLVSAVGANTGSEPRYTKEWHQRPVLKLSSYRLSTAYRTIPAAQSCAATGTTTAQWGAVAVVFR